MQGNKSGALLLLSLPNPAYLQRPNNEEPANPWEIYGCGDTPTPVVINGDSPATNLDMTLIDGTVGIPNPFYSKYYINAHSAHDSTGYWVGINADDSSQTATAVSVTGPGINGTATLEYNTAYGNWYYTNNQLAFSSSPLSPLPLAFMVTITDTAGTSSYALDIHGYVEQFATNLWPDTDQHADPSYSAGPERLAIISTKSAWTVKTGTSMV